MDLEKFICSLIKYHKPITEIEICSALKDQGLEYKGGAIVEVGQEKKARFKVGDWVTDGVSKCQIRFIDDTQYWYSENCVLGSIESVDKRYRLWTIGDAKDGDVLCSEQMILLFKKWEYTDWSFVIAHAGIDVLGQLQITNEHWLISNHAHPATKEERNLLFQKMKEAGYEFDFEKKELKKIEQKPADNRESSFLTAERAKKVSPFTRSGFENESVGWNEEDEDLLKCTINNLTELEQRFGKDYGKVGKCINWIKQKRWKKSLKTADLENSLCDIQDGYSDTSYEYRVLGEAIEFIRSTDDPHAWRPSDEQITWLYRAADDASKDSRMKQVLNELLSDLKKLREG